ncbi:hypothetical protein FRC06_005399 [Ceratobasidium sp. 370]|nr:hypothetical protein FRC06_005399 [Ceratobasidium sp. 370]
MAFMGVALFQGQLALVTPWMPNGTLMAYILKHPTIDRWKLCQQVAEGLACIHGLGMVHGDLKAANVFVSEEGVAKIGDLGNAILSDVSSDFTATSNVGGGTYRWMPRELLLRSSNDNSEVDRSMAADVFALAMVILEVMTGRRPYSEHESDPYVTLLVIGGIPPQRPPEFSSETRFGNGRWEMLNDCWRMEPEDRPTASGIRSRAYCLSKSVFGDTDGLTLDIGNFMSMVRSKNTHSLTTYSNQVEEEVHHARSINELETLVLDSVARLQSRPVFDETKFPIIGTHTGVEEVFKRLIDRGCTNFTTRLDMSQFPGCHSQAAALETYAVKCLRAHALKDQPTKCVKRAARELYNWSRAKHLYVLDLMGVAMFRGRLAMISPWMVNGTLEDYARKKTSAARWRLCIQVAEGLSSVHASGMVHGDLKAKNILVSDEGTVKLTDFGNSIFVSECSLDFTDTTNTAGGTTRWMKAPELLAEGEGEGEGEDEDTSRSQPADVYALGMTVLVG